MINRAIGVQKEEQEAILMAKLFSPVRRAEHRGHHLRAKRPSDSTTT